MSVNVIMRLTLIKESTYVTVQFDFKTLQRSNSLYIFFFYTNTN